MDLQKAICKVLVPQTELKIKQKTSWTQQWMTLTVLPIESKSTSNFTFEGYEITGNGFWQVFWRSFGINRVVWSVFVDNGRSGCWWKRKNEVFENTLTGKAKAAIESMGYNRTIYRLVWLTLAWDFQRPKVVLMAQLKNIHTYPFIKFHELSKMTKFPHMVSSCADESTQFGYNSDLTSESVLDSAVRERPKDPKDNWLT